MKITEKELKKIVAESVKKVLNESTWYGDTKPLEIIYNASEEIIKKLEYVNNSDYEFDGDAGSFDYYRDMYDWAVKVRDDAEKYIHRNSSFTSINGGENW